MDNILSETLKLKEKLKDDTLIVAHYYQKDEVFGLADIVGDSLELAKQSISSNKKNIVFCGVGFMGQSVKALNPNINVYMPKVACCAMARMIDDTSFDDGIKYLNDFGIKNEDILPVAYINCSAEVKAKVGKMDGYICTSANASIIMDKAILENKKIFFIPDRCLGQNIANKMGKKSSVIGDGVNPNDVDIVCFDGFCSVHQLFCEDDITFYKEQYPDILIISHPECDPKVVAKSDFVGSTSQILKYVKTLGIEQKIAVATEFNLVNRLRDKNTYVLSSSKPQCPTMNETTLQDVYNILSAIDKGENILNEIRLDSEIIKYANVALSKMMNLSK